VTAVRTDSDPEVLARAALLAWLDERPLELVPVAGLDDINHNAMTYIERFMATVHASVTWRGPTAEFTPDYQGAVA